MDKRITTVTTDAFLFDFDGVLADSTPAVERHWRQFATWYQLDPDEILQIMHGRRSYDTIVQALRNHSSTFVKEAWLRFEELDSSDQEGVKLLAGATDLLAALPPDRWAVITSGSSKVTRNRFQALGLPVPGVLVTGDDVAEGKPNPEGFLKASRLLKVDIKDCMIVEDAPSGLQAAHAAGAHLLAVATTHAASDLRDELEPTDLLISDLASVRVVNADDKQRKLVLEVQELL